MWNTELEGPSVRRRREVPTGEAVLVNRLPAPSLLLTGLMVVSLSACAPRGPNASAIPPPAVAAADEGLEGVLTESRSRSLSGEALLTGGEVESARSAFREAIALLETYMSARPDAGEALLPEIENLRIRLDEVDAVAFDGRNGIDTAPEVAIASLGILPILPNPWVEDRLSHYTEGTGRSTIELGLERIGLYGDMIRQIFREEGVPPDLIHLAQAESMFNPRAVSSSAARGMWQFMPARGDEYGLRQNWWIDERSDPEKSTRAAARHLRDLFEDFGDWYLALAAYNAGPGRVADSIRRAGSRSVWTLIEQRLLPPETRNYVPTVAAMAIIAAAPSVYGFDSTPLEATAVTRIPVPQATDLRIIADRLGLALEDLQDLNPHVLRWATPPGDPDFELTLPTAYAGVFESEVAPLPENERILFHHHIVQSGETLSHVARAYDVPVSAIAEANGLSDPNAIGVGQALLVPVSGLLPPASTGEGADTAPLSPPEIYEVRPGDTLTGIARRFGLGVEEIRDWNGLGSSLLIAGDLIRLAPTAVAIAGATGVESVYMVRPGDTLTGIAARLGTSINALRESNPDRDLSVIYPGDQLRVPRGGPPDLE